MRTKNTRYSSMPNELVFSFGPFRLYPKRQQLLLGNQPVKLGGRSFELLHLLVQRSGQLVRKDELIAAAWPDVYVHYSNLKVNMSSLRRSLGRRSLSRSCWSMAHLSMAQAGSRSMIS